MPATTSQATRPLPRHLGALPADAARDGVMMTYVARARQHRYERLWRESWTQHGLPEQASAALLDAARRAGYRRQHAALAAGGPDDDPENTPMG